jgi:hypothetical protein
MKLNACRVINVVLGSIFLLSLMKPQQYYQVNWWSRQGPPILINFFSQAFLAQAVGLGLGVGMTFIPATTAAVKHFPNRRPLASGIALSGAAAGSIIFPISWAYLSLWVGFVLNRFFLQWWSRRLSNCSFYYNWSASSRLIPKVGFGSAVRATAYVSLACIVSGNLLMRLPKQAASAPPPKAKKLLPKLSDMRQYLKYPPYICSVFG